MTNAARKIDHETRLIPRSRLTRFPLNRTIDTTDPRYIELRESIRAEGITTPLIVRPTTATNLFEIVAGESRALIATELGIDELLCVIREDLDEDDDALRVGAIENLQRVDLTPLDEAELYERMRANRDHLDHAERTPEQVASLLGKSPTHVRQRLRLVDLLEPMKAFARRRCIDAGGLLAIAQTSPAAQKNMLAPIEVLLKNQPTVTRADVTRLLQQGVTRDLSTVPWDLTDGTLVPYHVPCSVCTERTGGEAQRELLDVREVVGRSDVCLNGVCFGDHQSAAWARKSVEARAMGMKVLSPKRSSEVLKHGAPAHDSGFYLADGSVPVPGTMANRKIADLVKDAPKILAQDPRTGAPVELVTKEVVDKAAKAVATEIRTKKATSAKKSKAGVGAKASPTKGNEAARAKADHRERVEDRTRLLMQRSVVDRIRTKDFAVATVLSLLIKREAFAGEGTHQVVERRALAVVSNDRLSHLARSNAIDGELVRILDAPKNVEIELLALLAELHVADLNAYGMGEAKTLKSWGLDPEKLGRVAAQEIENEDRAAAAPKTPPVGKAKKKASRSKVPF